MAKEKNIKTNAMRILEKNKIPFRANFYTCDEFIDGIHIADMLSQPYGMSFKTLVATGKSKENYCFVLPIDKELDLKKAATCVGEKNIELLHVKDIKNVTGYIRGGCTAIGMKKQLRTVIHSSCLEYDEIIISGGALGVQLFITPDNFMLATGAESKNIIVE